MPTGLGMLQGFPGFPPQVLIREGQGVEDGELGRLLPAPHHRRDQPSEGEAPEVFFPLGFLGSVGSEEAGETPSARHRAN